MSKSSAWAELARSSSGYVAHEFMSPKFSNLQPPEPLFHFADDTCGDIPEAKTVEGHILPHVDHIASTTPAGHGDPIYDPVRSK